MEERPCIFQPGNCTGGDSEGVNPPQSRASGRQLNSLVKHSPRAASVDDQLTLDSINDIGLSLFSPTLLPWRELGRQCPELTASPPALMATDIAFHFRLTRFGAKGTTPGASSRPNVRPSSGLWPLHPPPFSLCVSCDSLQKPLKSLHRRAIKTDLLKRTFYLL